MVNLEIIKPNKEKALFFAKRELPEFVFDAVNLEGIHFTLPEVQTLLDGVTVGGHRLSDERITLNQIATWKLLFKWIELDHFTLNKTKACELHAEATKGEALEWGCFRSQGVRISGTDYMPPEANTLDDCWELMLQEAEDINDIFDRSIFVFLQMARHQFFYDVNKRMGRFMMNGILLSAGMPAINLPAKRQQEFNELMLEFYPLGNVAPMTEFMKSCLAPSLIKMMNE